PTYLFQIAIPQGLRISILEHSLLLPADFRAAAIMSGIGGTADAVSALLPLTLLTPSGSQADGDRAHRATHPMAAIIQRCQGTLERQRQPPLRPVCPWRTTPSPHPHAIGA